MAYILKDRCFPFLVNFSIIPTPNSNLAYAKEAPIYISFFVVPKLSEGLNSYKSKFNKSPTGTQETHIIIDLLFVVSTNITV